MPIPTGTVTVVDSGIPNNSQTMVPDAAIEKTEIVDESQLNHRTFVAQRTLVPTITAAVQLAKGVKIPKGCYLLLKALSGNGGMIYIARNKALAENTKNSFYLDANETVKLRIRTVDEVWIGADSANDGVNWIVEQD
ncbi:MAG: hypothetical protein PHU70_02040 [Dehalococcoidia bacterium]|nr:hypothetical protein [Dehalococcoidia bacterium]